MRTPVPDRNHAHCGEHWEREQDHAVHREGRRVPRFMTDYEVPSDPRESERYLANVRDEPGRAIHASSDHRTTCDGTQKSHNEPDRVTGVFQSQIGHASGYDVRSRT
jgi:hypothetical protein